ncbi:GNAT family N-acetyltransferase [Kribbella deserti]|uniref:GNAT family N-acetyltransferase n=1 Tax=Kribbella deserti TaxID=1926257 RepID=A0ABV6QIV6_9ACTN
MSESLPAGCTVRLPTTADAPAIYAAVAAYNTAILGYPNTSLNDIAEGLTDPAYDAERDGWLVFDADGRLVGYARVMQRTANPMITVEVDLPDGPVSGWLYRTATARARQLASEQGYAEVTLEAIAHRDDAASRVQLEANGFTVHTSYHRMRVDHPSPIGAPAPPPGCELAHGPVDEVARRAAYDVMVAAFDGQTGSALRPYDQWVEAHDRRPTFDWPQLLLVALDGQVVAACDTDDSFVETDNCGYVGRLGVRPEYRGRGLAKFLLRQAFAASSAAGREGTMLHVDTNNPTPALGLYESVGMRPIQVADVYHRTVTTG